MHQIALGIPLHAQPQRLQATLDSVQSNTALPVHILLLPDGPDAATAAYLSTSPLPRLATDEPRGKAACFNRLVTAVTADIYILLESGALVGANWLTHLLAALAADPHHGLAGPSTNHAWNEQAAFPRSGPTPLQVNRTAALAEQQFGPRWRTLEPLHSLGDFCYVVRREVIEAVGAADEAYGLGPCWEMDYNIRAARAGFRGVWACAAYVHRLPFTQRRRQAEAQHFDANKHLYQDRFCARQLRGEGAAYETHCRGEACEHFAPPDLIQIYRPLPDNPAPAVPESAKVEPIVTAVPRQPLISCIMPTHNRPDYVRQAIHYFRQQTYPERELLIMADEDDVLIEEASSEARVRYVRLPAGQSIGAKRNKACELARGEIIAHWDDDDWYAPTRLAAQAAPLLAGTADICGLTNTIFFDLSAWQFWTVTADLHRRLFVEGVHGGTLVYKRPLWQQMARYPDCSLAEDAAFLRQVVRRGARLHRLPNEALFVYLRHQTNSWSFTCGQYLNGRGWQRLAEPAFWQQDRPFYLAQQQAGQTSVPLVSCIMPTAGRRRFVPQAIAYFLQQDYPQRELIVLDDGADGVADLMPEDGRIRYQRLGSKQTVGAKRNLACQMARGELIAHWDDDDWYAPWRLAYQAAQLQAAQADVCGLDQVLYWNAPTRQAWLYRYPRQRRPWVAGNTLCYTRAFWQQNPFPTINIGEDTRFVFSQQAPQILALPDNRFCVGLIHPQNVSPKRPLGHRWQRHSAEAIQSLIGENWQFYARLGL
ncbi:MAG: glycosyltransferase [Ardenticatenaceae bacterium]|nr:glycosyltransferase [Ardenticatenaceae bacterium]